MKKDCWIFRRTPRTRAEIVDHLGLSTAQYALRRYLNPLVRAGLIQMTIPEHPRSKDQQFVTTKR